MAELALQHDYQAAELREQQTEHLGTLMMLCKKPRVLSMGVSASKLEVANLSCKTASRRCARPSASCSSLNCSCSSSWLCLCSVYVYYLLCVLVLQDTLRCPSHVAVCESMCAEHMKFTRESPKLLAEDAIVLYPAQWPA